MNCPKCLADHLLIRRPTGWERVMIHLTAKRKYVCMRCAHTFRAPDRRRSPRDQDDALLRDAQKMPSTGSASGI